MEQERRRALIFLILGMSMNTIAITQQAAGVKTTFHLVGIVFFIIAAIKFIRLKKAKDEEKNKPS